MDKTLILTGWSKKVYMTAAAAALEALKWKADVAGVSMDALVGALKDRAPNYKTVFVLGVGLKKNIGQTVSMLMELKTKGVRTVWLSSMPVAPEFAAERLTTRCGSGLSSRSAQTSVPFTGEESASEQG